MRFVTKQYYRGYAITSLTSYMTLGCRRSGPRDLLGFIFFSNFFRTMSRNENATTNMAACLIQLHNSIRRCPSQSHRTNSLQRAINVSAQAKTSKSLNRLISSTHSKRHWWRHCWRHQCGVSSVSDIDNFILHRRRRDEAAKLTIIDIDIDSLHSLLYHTRRPLDVLILATPR